MTGILTKCAICLLAILSGLVSIPAIAAPPEPATQETNKPLEPRALLRGNLSTVRAMAWSSDDKTLASGTNDGRVRVWDAKSLALTSEYEGHESYVVALRWSPKGDAVFSGGTDGSVLGCAATGGRQAEVVKGHLEGVPAGAVDGDAEPDAPAFPEYRGVRRTGVLAVRFQ